MTRCIQKLEHWLEYHSDKDSTMVIRTWPGAYANSTDMTFGDLRELLKEMQEMYKELMGR